jgi:uncharacterized protein related to proFAR isomerase
MVKVSGAGTDTFYIADFECILAKEINLSINMRKINDFAMSSLIYIHKAMMVNIFKTGCTQ